jgi:hypothetical protein
MSMPPQSKKYMAGFEPMYSGGRRPTWKRETPKLENFPQNRTVVIRRNRKQMSVAEQDAAIHQWLKDMNMKVKSFDEALVDDKVVSVVVLSSAKKAAIFKLAWG